MVRHLSKITLAVLAAAFTSTIHAAPESAKPDLKRDLERVLPKKRDLVWTKVPWRATLWDAVIDANAKKKPILLWAMNGHALACT
jgi:hypothetical protein